jgi:hypothetical protein
VAPKPLEDLRFFAGLELLIIDGLGCLPLPTAVPPMSSKGSTSGP